MPGGKPLDQLPGEQHVRTEHREHGQGQRGQHRILVADELADELLRPERDRLRGLPRRESQRKP